MTALEVVSRSPFFEFILEVERLAYRSNLDRCRQIGELLRPLLAEKGWMVQNCLIIDATATDARFSMKPKMAPSTSAALFGEPGKPLPFMTIGRGASSAYFLEQCNRRTL